MTPKKYELNAIKTYFFQNIANQGLSNQIVEPYKKLLARVNMVSTGLLIVFFILGALAAPLSFSNDGTQQLNTFWLLLILLGTHILSLLIWCLGLLSKAPTSYTESDWLASMLGKLSRWFSVPEDITKAYLDLRMRGQCRRWYMSRFLHSAWAAYLCGGLISALLFLATHRVEFIWATTLLSQQDIAALSQAISTVPNWFGLPTPAPSDIYWQHSQAQPQPDEVRKLWAIWVLSCILIYGVFVRLVLALLCHTLYRIQRHKQWFALANTAQQVESSTVEIIDSDSQHDSQASQSIENITPLPANSSDLAHKYYLFEWSKAIPKPLAHNQDLQFINDATTQSVFLQRQEQGQYLVIDADISPDRGSLRFLAQAAPYCNKIYLQGEHFQSAWQHALIERGISSAQLAQLKD